MTIREFMERYEHEMTTLEIFDRNGVELDDKCAIPPNTPVLGWSQCSGFWDIAIDL